MPLAEKIIEATTPVVVAVKMTAALYQRVFNNKPADEAHLQHISTSADIAQLKAFYDAVVAYALRTCATSRPSTCMNA